MRHGSNLDPPNRFESLRREADFEQVEWDQEYLQGTQNRKIEYLDDVSQSIVTENRSPDIPFRYSINPYRGCVHACSYCYARNTHEYLGFNAGLDFETKILVKRDAARLFREFLSRPKWRPEPIMFSGVTDCYQPAEREYRLTRECLVVAEECNLPVNIITKNALVLRDLDILGSLARRNLVHVCISVNTLNDELARTMEPRTSIPAARVRAIEILREHGIPVMVMVAPLIPGLNDHDVPEVLKVAKAAGALDARYILLRLPLTVEPVFREWLGRTQGSEVADKVMGRLQQMRAGKTNDSTWGQRMRGTGVLADQISTMFAAVRSRLGFAGWTPLCTDDFRPPVAKDGQLLLF